MSRTPKLPARYARALPATARSTERRPSRPERKAEDQDGLLWDKFRGDPAE